MGSTQVARRLFGLGQFAVEQHAQVPNVTEIVWSELHCITEGNLRVLRPASLTRQKDAQDTPGPCVFRVKIDRLAVGRLRIRSSFGCLREKIAKVIPGDCGLWVQFDRLA